MSKDTKTKIIRDSKGRFLPGSQASPGRPRHAKDKLCRALLDDLMHVWAEKGLQALYDMAENKPNEFVRASLGILPRDLTLLGENGERWVLNAAPALSAESWEEKARASMGLDRTARMIEHKTKQ